MKVVPPLAKGLATASCVCSKTCPLVAITSPLAHHVSSFTDKINNCTPISHRWEFSHLTPTFKRESRGFVSSPTSMNYIYHNMGKTAGPLDIVFREICFKCVFSAGKQCSVLVFQAEQWAAYVHKGKRLSLLAAHNCHTDCHVMPHLTTTCP